MTTRRGRSAAVAGALTALVALSVACGPAPSPAPASTTSTPTTTAAPTSTTAAPLPASIDVALTQPSHGEGVEVIGGQSAPLEYVVTVTNSGDGSSGPIVVTDTLHEIATLVTDSGSCGTVPGCTVAITSSTAPAGPTIAWSLEDVAANSSVELAFAATVDESLDGFTNITNQAFVTNVNTAGCTTPTCGSNTVTNPAEAFGFRPGGGIDPFNTVFYSGPVTFTAWNIVANDPDAELSYEWACLPDTLCELGTPHAQSTTALFRWDFYEHFGWTLFLTVTATRGDDTIVTTRYMDFDLEHRNCWDDPPSGAFGPGSCPWDVTGPNGEV